MLVPLTQSCVWNIKTILSNAMESPINSFSKIYIKHECYTYGLTQIHPHTQKLTHPPTYTHTNAHARAYTHTGAELKKTYGRKK